jgi:6-pyruvoyltetrahydropterin/6-carboxytetrahydropterin synthase
MPQDASSSLALRTRFVASSRFEAARQIGVSPGGISSDNKFARLHGHGFLVSAFVNQAPEPLLQEQTPWPPYAGGEVPALLAQLQTPTDQLNYQSLNERLAEPSDVNVACWFESQFKVPAVAGIALQSTPDQGVLVGSALAQKGGRALVWRRYRFQAAHLLPNVPVGHKCGRMHGHGFEVVLYAALDHDVVGYDTLDLAWAQVSAQLSYRCLNDVPGLENPTSEMLSSWLWDRLKGRLPSLTAVSVYETASCGATFDGQTYRIWKDVTIDSAVRYRHASANDPRSSVHGYTYNLRLSLSAPLDQVMGWTVDFGDVKAVFNPMFKLLDHHPLHESPELSAASDGDTGSMARWLFMKTQGLLPGLVRLDVFETEGCGASVGTDLQGPELPLLRV